MCMCVSCVLFYFMSFPTSGPMLLSHDWKSQSFKRKRILIPDGPTPKFSFRSLLEWNGRTWIFCAKSVFHYRAAHFPPITSFPCQHSWGCTFCGLPSTLIPNVEMRCNGWHLWIAVLMVSSYTVPHGNKVTVNICCNWIFARSVICQISYMLVIVAKHLETWLLHKLTWWMVQM